MGLFGSAVPSILPAEAARRAGESGAVFIDVRTPAEYASGHARGARNCPLDTLGACVDDLRAATAVYVICQSGGRSARATAQLRAAGVPAVNVAGGTSAWHAQGLSIA